jgi:ribosome maturation factor RimP
MDTTISEKLQALAAQAAGAEGCELFEIEFKPGRGSSALRVYIDKPGGVGVEDCAKVSRGLGLILETQDVIPGPYVLEVSSPGLTRQLKKPADFIRAAGKLAAVTARKGGKILGVIERADGEKVELRQKSGELIALNHSDITKANLEIEL